MPTPPLLYTCIAHNTTVLAEHTPFPSSSPNSSSVAQIASVVLPKISHDQPQKLTYTYGEHLINYVSTSKTASSLTFLLVTDKSVPRKTSFGFLQTIQQEFSLKYTPAMIEDAPPYGCAEFNKTLKEQIQIYAAGDGEDLGGNNARHLQAEIDAVRGIMTENIERVLERGERIDLLVDKTERLGEGARGFRVGARKLRRQMWWKDMKLMVLLWVVVIFLIYLFVGFGCGLPAWGKCFGR
ncbi:hypothetical protein DRE_01150 [Drechslerella stenobrocha 248]|uniref:Synaptobrevin homolog YKT6 n=1 Tax=Drechslerella stenobrocha 248 TaxID=1043628 RepID=W7HMI1_9PEZI|nr:hypothetical protein DRE_01150 [Drechslerella stenobrocha 248]